MITHPRHSKEEKTKKQNKKLYKKNGANDQPKPILKSCSEVLRTSGHCQDPQEHHRAIGKN